MRPCLFLAPVMLMTFESSPTTSAAGAQDSPGWIVFESLRGGGTLHMIRPDGTGLKRLTGGGCPSFSADGKKIVYAAYFNDTGSNDLFIIDADGKNDTRVTKTPDMEQGPALSPDGKLIAFTLQETQNNAMTNGLYVMNSDGSGRKRLVEGETPAWSPDGSKIAFAAIRKQDGSTSEIYVIDADGSNERRVTRNELADRSPAWSPDGRLLAYSSYTDRKKRWDICVIGADGAGEKRLTSEEAEDDHPCWSPDGSRIAFCSNREKEGKQEIFVMGSDGSNPTNISKNAAQDTYPTWGKGK